MSDVAANLAGSVSKLTLKKEELFSSETSIVNSKSLNKQTINVFKPGLMFAVWTCCVHKVLLGTLLAVCCR